MKLHPICKKKASTIYVIIGHLKYLIDKVSKDKHGLILYDIEPKDRQNFKSAEKVSNSKIIHLLSTHVPNSEGTILYLRIINNLITAYMDPAISPFERIYLPLLDKTIANLQFR